MRLLVLDCPREQSQRLPNGNKLAQACQKLQVDVIVALNVCQHVQAGRAHDFGPVALPNDGISCVYQDNLAFHLYQALFQQKNEWSWGYGASYLHVDYQLGVGFLQRTSNCRMWTRKISTTVKLHVIDSPAMICAVVVNPIQEPLTQAIVDRVHDLLRAQIKPIYLITSRHLESKLVKLGWQSGLKLAQQTTDLWSLEQTVFVDFGAPVASMQPLTKSLSFPVTEMNGLLMEIY